MTASVELQAYIVAVLEADAAVSSLVGQRIYDNVPEGAQYPYLTFGPSDGVPLDFDCVTTITESLQIDCWCRENGQIAPAKALAGAVKAALHDRSGDIGTHALSNLQCSSVRAFRDPDGITGHGIVYLRAELEENG